MGFVVDAGLTLLLIRAGAQPLFARPPAVLVAMLCTWLANRRFTFAIRARRNMIELSRYLAVAGLALALNLGIYSLLIVFDVAVWLSIVTATALQTCVTFLGYKNFAFQQSSSLPGGRSRDEQTVDK